MVVVLFIAGSRAGEHYKIAIVTTGGAKFRIML
jgi:hypothetical protein